MRIARRVGNELFYSNEVRDTNAARHRINQRSQNEADRMKHYIMTKALIKNLRIPNMSECLHLYFENSDQHKPVSFFFFLNSFSCGHVLATNSAMTALPAGS